MSIQVTALGAGLIGVLFGAFVNHALSALSESRSKFLELKSKAYADYIDSVAALAFCEDSNRREALRQVTHAKAAICVFGDRKVINGMFKLEGTSMILSKTDARNAMIELLQSMRRLGVATGGVSNTQLKKILFS